MEWIQEKTEWKLLEAASVIRFLKFCYQGINRNGLTTEREMEAREDFFFKMGECKWMMI